MSDIETRMTDLEQRMDAARAHTGLFGAENMDILKWQTDADERIKKLTAQVEQQGKEIERLRTVAGLVA